MYVITRAMILKYCFFVMAARLVDILGFDHKIWSQNELTRLGKNDHKKEHKRPKAIFARLIDISKKKKPLSGVNLAAITKKTVRQMK